MGVNSIECSQCKLWVHKKCSGLTGRLVADPEFVCQRCRGVACPIDGRPVTHVDVDVDGTQLDVEATFCYLGDMFSAGGGCDRTIAARCCAAWSKFRKLLPILTSKHISFKIRGKVFTTSQLVFGQLCSMAVRPGPQTLPIYSGFAEMTVP